MKRSLTYVSLIVALFIALLSPHFVAGARATSDFPDIPANASYANAVRQLVDRGILRGYADGRFGPYDPLLRAQTAATLVRALDLANSPQGRDFSDRSATDPELWAAVRILAARDIARGFTDGTFGPIEPLTRQQALSFITRAMVAVGRWQPQPLITPFADVAPDHRPDVATYVTYVGGIPDIGGTQLGAGAGASRGWYAGVLWAAIASVPTAASTPGTTPTIAAAPPLPVTPVPVTPPSRVTPTPVPPITTTPTPATPRPTMTATPSPITMPPPSASPPAPPTVSSTPSASPSPSPAPYLWGMIGSSEQRYATGYDAGVRAQVLRISWRDYFPAENQPSSTYVAQKRAEIATMRRAGFVIIVDLGLHDTPDWLHQNYTDSYYVNQYGERYSGAGTIDSGDANLIFNPTLRAVAASYISTTFTDLGTDFYAVRLGGGHWGELTYPSAKVAGSVNCYWAFDRNALSSSPTPNWHPGKASLNGEAGRFLAWYLDTLTGFQDWQIDTIRQQYTGSLMILYPGWGIRPGQFDAAVAGNLGGLTSAEINGEVQTGTDYARQVSSLRDQGVILTTTWLDAPFGDDNATDPALWRPVKYLAYLAAQHSFHPKLFGENTGQGNLIAMQYAASQMRQYGLLGMAWCREEELFSGNLATIEDYRQIIATVR